MLKLKQCKQYFSTYCSLFLVRRASEHKPEKPVHRMRTQTDILDSCLKTQKTTQAIVKRHLQTTHPPHTLTNSNTPWKTTTDQCFLLFVLWSSCLPGFVCLALHGHAYYAVRLNAGRLLYITYSIKTQVLLAHLVHVYNIHNMLFSY